MAGYGDQRALQPLRHVLHEAGLAASRRPLEEDGQPVAIGGLEYADLVAHRLVVGLFLDPSLPRSTLGALPRKLRFLEAIREPHAGPLEAELRRRRHPSRAWAPGLKTPTAR